MKPTLKSKIKAKGLSIGFLEAEMKLPRNTFYNHVNGSKEMPLQHKPVMVRVLSKYNIKCG
jgi:hypothetical protein